MSVSTSAQTSTSLFASSTNHFIDGILIELHKSSDLQIRNQSLTDHLVQSFLSEVHAGGGFLAIKKLDRMAPLHDLTQWRWEKVGRLLTESAHSIEMVADSVGYQPLAAFNPAF